MNDPYPPLFPIPDRLSDEAAAQLIEALYEFARLLENHYAAQLQRHYARHDDHQLALWDDPPF
jgi:hypothetical protein